MTVTLQEANRKLRGAVEERLAATPADDPKLAKVSCCEGQPMRAKRPTGSQSWIDAHNRLGRLHIEKTAQYGGDADPFENVTASAKCGVEPWRRALCDLSDCVVRMQKFAQGQEVDYENALLDAANWALICLIKIQEEKRGS